MMFYGQTHRYGLSPDQFGSATVKFLIYSTSDEKGAEKSGPYWQGLKRATFPHQAKYVSNVQKASN